MTAQAIPVQQLDELHGHRWLLAATELSGKTGALLACTDSREESEESSQHGCEGSARAARTVHAGGCLGTRWCRRSCSVQDSSHGPHVAI